MSADPGAAALRELVLPVVVVSAFDQAATACATTTASYVWLRPPMVCVALRPDSRTAQMVLRTGRLCVSALGADQAGLARSAGQPAAGPDKMADAGIALEWPPSGQQGPPGVGGAAAVLWCEVAREPVSPAESEGYPL